MLAQLEAPTNDFMALASYLIHGKERPTNPKRVAWTLAHNLHTTDPILAAHYMTATAELSRRCKNACYHAMIAWHPDERPSPEMMQEIAQKTLHLADLGDHQALIMGHGDKAHAHLHMMINRVHPTTGRAWSTSHDYRRFDRIMKLLSEDYGFQYVPAHSFNPELTDELPKQPNSNATYAAQRGADTGRRQWSRSSARALGKRVSERLDRNASWDDMEFAMAEEGLEIQPKGKGLIVGNSKGYAKFSALGLKGSAQSRSRRLSAKQATRRPPTRSEPGRTIWTVDAIDIAKAIGTKHDVRHAVLDATKVRFARRARLALMQQLMLELKDDFKGSTSLKKPRTVARRHLPSTQHSHTKAR